MSKYNTEVNDLILGLNADLQLTFAWLEDTLYPSVNLMALKGFIFDMQTDVKMFEDKHGKSDKTVKSLERINQMIELADKLDRIANQNNTAQLLLRQNQLKMSKLIKENNELKKQIESINEAWNQTET